MTHWDKIHKIQCYFKSWKKLLWKIDVKILKIAADHPPASEIRCRFPLNSKLCATVLCLSIRICWWPRNDSKCQQSRRAHSWEDRFGLARVIGECNTSTNFVQRLIFTAMHFRQNLQKPISSHPRVYGEYLLYFLQQMNHFNDTITRGRSPQLKIHQSKQDLTEWINCIEVNRICVSKRIIYRTHTRTHPNAHGTRVNLKWCRAHHYITYHKLHASEFVHMSQEAERWHQRYLLFKLSAGFIYLSLFTLN